MLNARVSLAPPNARFCCGALLRAHAAYTEQKALCLGAISLSWNLTWHMTLQDHATNVERYNPVVDKWEQVCKDTPISRAFMSAVAVDV